MCLHWRRRRSLRALTSGEETLVHGRTARSTIAEQSLGAVTTFQFLEERSPGQPTWSSRTALSMIRLAIARFGSSSSAMRRRLAATALSMRALAWARYLTMPACSSAGGTRTGHALEVPPPKLLTEAAPHRVDPLGGIHRREVRICVVGGPSASRTHPNVGRRDDAPIADHTDPDTGLVVLKVRRTDHDVTRVEDLVSLVRIRDQPALLLNRLHDDPPITQREHRSSTRPVFRRLTADRTTAGLRAGLTSAPARMRLQKSSQTARWRRRAETAKHQRRARDLGDQVVGLRFEGADVGLDLGEGAHRRRLVEVPGEGDLVADLGLRSSIHASGA